MSHVIDWAEHQMARILEGILDWLMDGRPSKWAFDTAASTTLTLGFGASAGVTTGALFLKYQPSAKETTLPKGSTWETPSVTLKYNCVGVGYGFGGKAPKILTEYGSKIWKLFAAGSAVSPRDLPNAGYLTIHSGYEDFQTAQDFMAPGFSEAPLLLISIDLGAILGCTVSAFTLGVDPSVADTVRQLSEHYADLSRVWHHQAPSGFLHKAVNVVENVGSDAWDVAKIGADITLLLYQLARLKRGRATLFTAGFDVGLVVGASLTAFPGYLHKVTAEDIDELGLEKKRKRSIWHGDGSMPVG